MMRLTEFEAAVVEAIRGKIVEWAARAERAEKRVAELEIELSRRVYVFGVGGGGASNPSCGAKRYIDQSYKLPDIVTECALPSGHNGRHEDAHGHWWERSPHDYLTPVGHFCLTHCTLAAIDRPCFQCEAAARARAELVRLTLCPTCGATRWDDPASTSATCWRCEVRNG